MNSTLGFSAPASTKKKKRKAAAQRGRSNRVQKSSEKNAESQNDSGHPEVVSDQTVAIPKVIDGYKIIRCLGKGGMGVVYEAHDSRLNRKVALKVLKAGQDAEVDVILRFRREAEHVARLRHPHIVSIFDIGTFEYQDYFTMDLIKGVTFDEWIRKERPTFKQRVGVIQKVAEAIHYAHGMKIIHRDLKPENILIDEEGEPHVMDFGLARNVSVSSRLTITGMTLGTPNYMSPEQAKAKKNVIGPCSDVWSLGVVLYESLAGRPPFWAENIYATLISVINDSPEKLRKLDRKIPKDLETICMKCLEKNRFKRYSTAQSLADDLGAWLSGDMIQARPPSVAERAVRRVKSHPLLSASSLLILIFAVVAGWFHHDKRVAEWAMIEQKRLDTVKQEHEVEIKHNKADLDAVKAGALLKSARQQLANGKTEEANRLLIDAHALFASVLHEIPKHHASKKGVGEVISLEFKMALFRFNWEQANIYLVRAANMGLGESEILRLRSALIRAQAAERAAVRNGVRDLMNDSILGAERKVASGAAEAKLRILPRELVILELLTFISSEHMEQQLLASNSLGGIGDLRVARKLLSLIQNNRSPGNPLEYPVQVAIFNAICQIAPLDNDVYFKLQNNFTEILKQGVHSEFERDTRLFRKPYFIKMITNQRNKRDARFSELGGRIDLDQSSIFKSTIDHELRMEHSRGAQEKIVDEFGDEVVGENLKGFLENLEKILREDPSNLAALRTRGDVRASKGDTVGAWEDYTKLIQFDPDNPDVFMLRGTLNRDTSSFEKSLSDFTKVINLDPERTSGYLKRGGVYRQLGKLDAAQRDYQLAIRLSPKNLDGWRGRGHVRNKMGKYEAAIGDFTKALEISPRDSSSYSGRAHAYDNLGEIQKASDEYAKAIALRPDEFVYRRARSEFRLKIKDYAGALQDLAYALKIKPRNGFVWMLQGRARAALGDVKTAMEDFSTSIHFSYNEDVPYQERGRLFQMTEQYLEAIEDLEKAISLNEKNWKAHLYLGLSLNSLGKKEEARNSIDLAMALSPDAMAYFNSIKSTLRGGLPRQEKRMDSVRARILLAENKVANEKFEEALVELQQVLQLRPTRARTFYLLATCHDHLYEYKEANKFYREAVVRAPMNAKFLNHAAWFLLTCQDESMWAPKDALILAQKAAALSENRDAKILDTLALALFRNKRPADAVRVQQAAIAKLGKAKHNSREGYLLKLNRYKIAVEEQALTPEK